MMMVVMVMVVMVNVRGLVGRTIREDMSEGGEETRASWSLFGTVWREPEMA